MFSISQSAQNLIKFDRLRELHIHGTDLWYQRDNWLIFIAQNQEFRTLNTGRFISRLDECMEIVNSLPHFVEINSRMDTK